MKLRPIPVCFLTMILLTQAGTALVIGAVELRAEDSKPVTVLELFTSQGCSSCPPADALLGKLAARKDIVGLTLPVDYWDYLGWKDTLANAAHSTRQRTYAKGRGDHQVYTPQVVVNGLQHVNGADYHAIQHAAAATRKELAGRRVALSLEQMDGDTLKVEIGATPPGSAMRSGIIWLALVKKSATVDVPRGENGGRKLTYHNVVRELAPVGKWSGEAMTLKLPYCRHVREDIDSCVLMLQQGRSGPIVAAIQHNWK